MTIELCHKCSGQITTDYSELHNCGCISTGGGVYAENVADAATKQAFRAIQWLILYQNQNRNLNDQVWKTTIRQLQHAMKHSPFFGYGNMA